MFQAYSFEELDQIAVAKFFEEVEWKIIENSMQRILFFN
jgi:hypothetical protein